MREGMDLKRHERGSEAMLHDFALVTTYLPILGLTLRAGMLVAAMYWLMYTLRVPFAAVIILSASVVYVDALFLRSPLDCASGHLCLAALAVITQQHARECSDAATVALWVCDILWSACTSAEAVGCVSMLRAHVPAYVKVIAVCAFASMHVLLSCAAASMLEMLVRAGLFYVLCSLMVLCAPFAPPPDRTSCSALHVCAPLLFVHAYPTLASVILLVGAHARLVYNSMNKRGPNDGGATIKQSEYSDLAAKLQAAKRAQGMA
jgi:hypothetical protein